MCRSKHYEFIGIFACVFRCMNLCFYIFYFALFCFILQQTPSIISVLLGKPCNNLKHRYFQNKQEMQPICRHEGKLLETITCFWSSCQLGNGGVHRQVLRQVLKLPFQWIIFISDSSIKWVPHKWKKKKVCVWGSRFYK